MLKNSLHFSKLLNKLTLKGILAELPQWLAHLNTLRILHLVIHFVDSMLVSDQLQVLSKLTNLISLSLFHAYTREQIGCDPGEFLKLRYLHITTLIELEEGTPTEDTMPCIQFLKLSTTANYECFLKALNNLELSKTSLSSKDAPWGAP